MTVYDLYEVRAKRRSHDSWTILGKREPYWVKKPIQPKWWQFWKSGFDQMPPKDLDYLDVIFDKAVADADTYSEVQFVGYRLVDDQGGSYYMPIVLRSMEIPLAEHICWMCKKGGATIRTRPQPPDNEEWWFHEKCYWNLQDILY